MLCRVFGGLLEGVVAGEYNALKIRKGLLRRRLVSVCGCEKGSLVLALSLQPQQVGRKVCTSFAESRALAVDRRLRRVFLIPLT